MIIYIVIFNYDRADQTDLYLINSETQNVRISHRTLHQSVVLSTPAIDTPFDSLHLVSREATVSFCSISALKPLSVFTYTQYFHRLHG